MARFMIEIPHGEDPKACNQAIQTFLNTDSYFLYNANWGCKDGQHKAWLTLDVDTKAHARNILPRIYRRQAKIIKLVKFSIEDPEDNSATHNP